MWIETLLTKIETFYSKDFLVASFLPVLLFATALGVTFTIVVGLDAALGFVSTLTEDRKISALVLTCLALGVLAYVVGAVRIQFLRFWSGDWMLRKPFILLFSPLLHSEKERFEEYYAAAARRSKWSDVFSWVEEGSYHTKGAETSLRAFRLYENRGRAPGGALGDWLSAEASVKKDMVSRYFVLSLLSDVDSKQNASEIEVVLNPYLYRLSDSDLGKVYEEIKKRRQQDLIELGEAKARLDRCFGSPHTTKPTRLGNIVESFLAYPVERYQLEGNIFWSRLQHFIPEPFMKRITESRTILDFALTLATLSCFYCIIIAIAGPWLWRNVGFWGAAGSFGILAMWSSYRLSIIAAEQFGEHFRAAFDLFRLKLLSGLHRSHPDKLSQEREKWSDLGRLIVFGHPKTDIEIVAEKE